MHRVRAALARGAHVLGRIEIRRDLDRLVGRTRVQRAAIVRSDDRDGRDALVAARAEDPQRDLASVRNEQPSHRAEAYAARVNPTFVLGGELEVRRLGFGAMRIVEDRDEGIRVLRRAVELGVTLIDTADIYGTGRSEEIIAEALHPYPEGLVLGTKGGLGGGFQDRVRDGRPEYLRRACEASLRRLKLERIDLYQLHRHDPEVPIEESIGALRELRDEGKIRLIGVSNVSLEQLRAAQSVANIVSVQNQYNRGLLTSEDVLQACEDEGIAFFPWNPLGEGLREPEFELRWLLDHSPVLLPIPGTSKVSHLEANMRAVT